MSLTPELAAKLRPIHGYVLLQFPKGTIRSQGGIILMEEHVEQSNYWTMAKVIVVDPRGVPSKSGKRVSHSVKPGDIVVIYKIFGDIAVDGVVHKREMRVVSEDQITAVIDDPDITEEDRWYVL